MSVIKRAIDAQKKRNQLRRSTDPLTGATDTNVATASGVPISRLLPGLLPSKVEQETLEQNKILPAIDDRAAVAAYKMLRTRVLQRMRANNWHTLLVTSAAPEEGKTLTACNLAVSISRDVNQSVFLVDLDLQRSSVAKYFGLEVKKGIGDYLAGEATIEDIVYVPEGLERIAIIPNRERVDTASESLASPQMRTLTSWLREHDSSRLVIFDMPPVLASDDVLAFAPQVDALLLIVAQGLTHRASWNKTLEMLGEHNVLGVVLNRSDGGNQAALKYY